MIFKMQLFNYMILLFLQLLTSSSHAGDDMKDEDIWDLGGEPNTDCEDMDQEDLDGEDMDGEDWERTWGTLMRSLTWMRTWMGRMDGEDWDDEDKDKEMEGDGGNIGSDKGGLISDEFNNLLNEQYG